MAKKNFNGSQKIVEPRINDEIVGYENVRLVYKEKSDETGDNDFNKVVSIREARRLSSEYGLDLIEVNSKVNPPIVRLQNYSKYLWELKKTFKAKPKTAVALKEVQLSTNISMHDLEVKANKAKEFIANGNKVKVVLTMRGRELGRREVSKESFRTFIGLLSEVAVYDTTPKDEGNKTYAILRRK